MKKIRIAQIGTSRNSHGGKIWNSLKKQTDLFEIVGYALPEGEREKFPEQMEDFAGYPEKTVEQLLSDPTVEALTVETEELYLTKYALLGAQAGKHIHMEKPGGADLAEFEALVASLRAQKLAFSVGYMYRFNPLIQESLAKIERGDLGEIYAVEAHMDCPHGPEVRQWLSNFPGGMMFFLGCHLVDLIYRIQGEPEAVCPFNCSTGFDGVTGLDYGMAVFRYKNGVSFAKTCANERGGFLRRQLVICGSKGTIELRPLEVQAPAGQDGQYTVMRETYSGEWHIPGKDTQTPLYDRYDPMLRHFAQMVRGEISEPDRYDYELNVYRLVLRACGEEPDK